MIRTLDSAQVHRPPDYQTAQLSYPTYFLRGSDFDGTIYALDASPLEPGITYCHCFGGGTCIAVANGAGYLLPKLPELDAVFIDFEPIRAYAEAPAVDGIVFANFTEACLATQTGVVWTTERLSYDGIHDLRVVDGRVLAHGYNAPTGDEKCAISVELISGRIIESAYP